MKLHRLPGRPRQRHKAGQERDEPPLQPARRADADQLPHEESEIEAAGMDQHALENVRVPAEMQAAHAAGLVEMGEGPFQSLAAEPQQTQAARTSNAPTIAIHRVPGFRVVLPVAPSSIRFGDIAADVWLPKTQSAKTTSIECIAARRLRAIATSISA
jgi:hypothetical protein